MGLPEQSLDLLFENVGWNSIQFRTLYSILSESFVFSSKGDYVLFSNR